MRIIVESDPGFAGRAMANHVADKIRAAVPKAEVVVAGPVLPRLPAGYAALAPRDYGVRQMLKSA